MTRRGHYIRFEGRLWENNTFEFEPGWETALPETDAEGEDTYLVEIRSAEDETLVSRSPRVFFQSELAPEAPGSRAVAHVRVFVPFHLDGRKLVFRHGEYVIFEREIAPAPPSVRIEAIDRRDENEVVVRWSTSETDDLTYNVEYTPDGDSRILLGYGLDDQTFVADLSRVPGSDDARLLVTATDGIRSSTVSTDAMSVPEKPPTVWIQQPVANAELPADQPISLIGQAVDLAGGVLREERLVWRLDEEIVTRGTRLALLDGLYPDDYRISLEYTHDNEVVAATTIGITITDRTPSQERYRTVMERLDEEEADAFE